ncbi:MAG: helix-hairpin-helix domain-containing protein [Acholeplasmatales bacterium]|nr:helix-hairpin-helix domain-containing protein [Acholeplasmatales bacterium]
MKRKKEIIIIIFIVIIAIFLIILPLIINNTSTTKSATNTENNNVDTDDNTIKITVYGEITYKPINSISDDDLTNEISFDALSGITYGEVINRISNYLTNYSIIDSNLTKRYFDSSKIYIKSSLKKEEIEINNPNEGKININTATLDELTTLHGIGEKRANRIIDYIAINGDINSFEELKKLIGVSDEIITIIKEKAFL